MMSRIDRIRRAVSARKAASYEDSPVDETFEVSPTGLPATSQKVSGSAGFRQERRDVDSGYVAQLLGQHGERRGLRAGASLLERARSAYSRIEWSGSWDRRARQGRRSRDI
jgi:hypothetical protein